LNKLSQPLGREERKWDQQGGASGPVSCWHC